MQFKTCSLCKQRKPIDEFGLWKHSKDGRNHRCKECHNEANRKSWAATGSEKRREKYHNDALVRSKMMAASKAARLKNPEKCSNMKKQRNQDLRLAALTEVGLSCVCCQETLLEFLSLDHINGGGTQHRKVVGDSQKMYRQILTDPETRVLFQTLCHNCNQAKGFYGYCPHQPEVKI